MDDQDRKELQRLVTLGRQLQGLAYLFERFGGECSGDCEEPVRVAFVPMPLDPIVCCNLMPAYHSYMEIKHLERQLRKKIDAERRREAA